MAHTAELRSQLLAKQDDMERLLTEATQDDGSLDFAKIKSRDNGAHAVTMLGEELKQIGEELDAATDAEKYAADAKARSILLNADDHDETEISDAADTVGLVIDNAKDVLTAREAAGKLIRGGYLKERRGEEMNLNVGLKALFSTGAGFAPESTRTGDIVAYAHRPVQLLDRLRQVPTNQSSVLYMEQTTRTAPSDGGIAEGAAYPEAAFAYTEQTVPVRKRGAFIPATEEQLEDEPGVRALVEQDLIDVIREDIDNQLITGDGTGANLLGLSEVTGTGSQTMGSDPLMTAFKKAMTKVRVDGRAMPDMALIHPNQWDQIVTAQMTTGGYILGMPNQEFSQRLWGVSVQLVEAVGSDTVWVGDFGRHCIVRDRRDVTIRSDNQYESSGSQIKPTGRVMIWGDARLAVVWRRPAAFVEIDVI